MQISLPQIRWSRPGPAGAAWIGIVALAVALWAPVAVALWVVWEGDPSLSHGFLVPLVAAGLIAARRKAFSGWNRADAAGMALLAVCALVHVGAVWADVEFVKPLSLIGMLAGGVWYLGGRRALAVSAGPLGFLAFMVPWPTTVVERIAFPLQLTSSAYAALMGGLLGLPVQRHGVHLAIVPDPSQPPTYAVLVARQCSGLTSLLVLLALGYLVAYFTRAPLGWRALLLLAVVPIALFTNALRITFILIAGAYHSAGLAQWVHDHEAPVLIFFCSLGLMGLRHALTVWTNPATQPGGAGASDAGASPSPPSRPRRAEPGGPAPARPAHLMAVNAALVLTLAGSAWGRHLDAVQPRYGDFLQAARRPFRGWQTRDVALSPTEQSMLEPDSVLVRRYQSPGADFAELAVIAGHKKKTVHTPGFCMVGDGWQLVSQRPHLVEADGRSFPALRTLMTREGGYLVTTYFFTDGEQGSRSLVQFQMGQLAERLRGRPPLGALVRILAPVTRTPESAERLSDEFAAEVLPPVLARLRDARAQAR